VNSVNSYGYIGFDQEIFGPFFDQTVKDVIYDWAISQ
jgi:hypothetical protein